MMGCDIRRELLQDTTCHSFVFLRGSLLPITKINTPHILFLFHDDDLAFMVTVTGLHWPQPPPFVKDNVNKMAL